MELAERLKINRSNIASYEKGTNPPVEVLTRMATLFHVSLDMLITADLEALMHREDIHPLQEAISMDDVCERLQQFISLTGKDTNKFGSLTGIDVARLKQLLKNRSSEDLTMLCKLFSTYSWLNANWLWKGGAEHPIRLDESVKGLTTLPDAAETGELKYQSGLLSRMDELLKRIEQLESETKHRKP